MRKRGVNNGIIHRTDWFAFLASVRPALTRPPSSAAVCGDRDQLRDTAH